MSTVTIASIYPLHLVEERPGYMPQSRFELPAAAPGEVQYLVVPDCQIDEYAGYGKNIRTADKTTAQKVAADLVRCWTQGYPGVSDPSRSSPGIMIIRGEEIAPDELDKLNDLQTQFARDAVLDADLHHSKKRPDLITRRHHKLAEWLKVTNRPWQEKLDRAATKNCPFCGASNVSAASKCANCREIIDKARYDALTSAIRDGRAEEVQAVMQSVENRENASVESLSQDDVNEMLVAAGVPVGHTGKRK